MNLKDARLGSWVISSTKSSGSTAWEKGACACISAPGEQFASLTVNEDQNLLMRDDLAEVLKNPLRFAAQKAKHAWNYSWAPVPSKAIDYAKDDSVRALNRLVDALGLAESAFERVFSQALAVPASRFLRMKRSVSTCRHPTARKTADAARLSKEMAGTRRPSWCNGGGPSGASVRWPSRSPDSFEVKSKK